MDGWCICILATANSYEGTDELSHKRAVDKGVDKFVRVGGAAMQV